MFASLLSLHVQGRSCMYGAGSGTVYEQFIPSRPRVKLTRFTARLERDWIGLGGVTRWTATATTSCCCCPSLHITNATHLGRDICAAALRVGYHRIVCCALLQGMHASGSTSFRQLRQQKILW